MTLIEYFNTHSISKADFAKLIDVSAGMLSQWISGHRPISPEKCVAIEQATNGEVTRKDMREDWREIWPELLAVGTPDRREQRHLSDRRKDRRHIVIKP